MAVMAAISMKVRRELFMTSYVVADLRVASRRLASFMQRRYKQP
jgi:hypothetical protein